MSSDLIHVWYRCHGCGARPIVGPRSTCRTCPAGPDSDLCATCYERFRRGELRHPPETSFAGTLQLGEHRFESSDGLPREGFAHWLEPPQPDVLAPQVPAAGFVVRPEFRTSADSFLGAYGFAVEHRGAPLLVTALHILDELIRRHGIDASGSNAGYTGRELPDLVTEVCLYDVFAANWVLAQLGSAGPMLVLPDARIDDEEPDSHRDVAAFRLRDAARLVPGRLAERPPERGDPVWLVAKVLGPSRQPSPVRTLRAVVVERTATAMVFRFADPELEAPYSSGAPILDAAGDVVGINVGGGWLEGAPLGHAHHVGNLRRHLAAGLESTP